MVTWKIDVEHSLLSHLSTEYIECRSAFATTTNSKLSRWCNPFHFDSNLQSNSVCLHSLARSVAYTMLRGHRCTTARPLAYVQEDVISSPLWYIMSLVGRRRRTDSMMERRRRKKRNHLCPKETEWLSNSAHNFCTFADNYYWRIDSCNADDDDVSIDWRHARR